MKKGGILNPAICSLLAELGQTDELLIVNAAYPLPTDGHVIDLTLTPGIPRLLDVLRAVTEELVVDSIAVPAEIKEFSPRIYQEILKIVGDTDVDEVPFHEFKEQAWTSRGSSARPNSARTPASDSSPGARFEVVIFGGRRSTGIMNPGDDPPNRSVGAGGEEVRGGRRKPDPVETPPGRFHARPEPRMIIYLGRRLPDASSDLPGSHDGSGRSVGGGRWGSRFDPWCPSRPFALPPYLVLLPMGFTEPGRSPGLLVSSYLAVSPLPRSRRREATRPRRFIFCGTVPIQVAFAVPDGGRYPPSRPVESGLSSVASPQTQALRPAGFPTGPGASAQAPGDHRPATNSDPIIRAEVRPNNPR